MELGLLSNMLVNSQPYWQAYVPPVVFGDRRRPNQRADRGTSASRLGATHRVEIGPFPSQSLRHSLLVATERASRHCDPFGVAEQIRRSARELRHRRVEARGDQDRDSGDDRASRSMLHRLSGSHDGTQATFPAGKIRLAAACRQHGYFLSRARRASRTSSSIWAAVTSPCIRRSSNIAKRAGSSISIPIGSCSERNSGGRRPAPSISSLTPREVIDPKTKTAFSPLSPRYFEGLAAGTRLLGAIPASGEYNALLPTDALCEVSLDGSDLAERLDRDRQNPSNQRAVDAAATLVREHHSWRRRGQQIYSYLEHGGPLDLNLMPQARNRADIAAALTS